MKPFPLTPITVPTLATPVASSQRSRRYRLAAAALLLTPLLACPVAHAVDVAKLFTGMGAGTTGSGTTVDEVRKIGSFSGLSLHTNARVEIRQGEQPGVEVQADDNVVRLIDSYIEHGTLKVEDRERFKSSIARVIVTVVKLDSLSSGGSTAVACEALKVPALAIQIGGSSAVRLASLHAGRLDVSMGGSSTLKVVGTADDLNASLGGSSAMEAGKLVARKASVSAGGSARALVGRSDALSLSLGGSSTVGYYGAPTLAVASGGSASFRSLGNAP